MLRILIDCSQLSKTCNYNVLFGSSARIVRHDAYIGGRSENNIKCVLLMISSGRTEQLVIIAEDFSATSLALRVIFLGFIDVEHIRFFHRAL